MSQPEVGGVADVIEIAMGKNDQLERAWDAPSCTELSNEDLAGIRTSGVDKDVADIGEDEITVDRARTKGEGECNRED
jgi:hypothetical protein